MRAEQYPQLMKGRLVLVTKTVTRRLQMGHGVVPSSRRAGTRTIDSCVLPFSWPFSMLASCSGAVFGRKLQKILRRGLFLSWSWFVSKFASLMNGGLGSSAFRDL